MKSYTLLYIITIHIFSFLSKK